ncbi:MAG: hypothetical protein HC872_04220 [Gammaproteobacteria bacterium]|nr:hypothetical protein [Gammaproteobacteria bacterium]
MYSELRAHIDARSTVKRHVLEHLAEFVAINTWLQDGQIWYHNRSGAPQPLQSHSAYGRFDPYLYVDPRGGILREIPGRSVRKPHRARKHRAGQAALDARRRILSDTEQLLAIDGIWYHIVLAKLPEPRCVRGREVLERHWDVVRSAWVSAGDAQRFREEWARGKYLFGSSTLYAVSKRQLGKRELRAAGLSR